MILLIVFAVVCTLLPETRASDRPIIGVLTQETSRVFELMYQDRYDCFIPASYVKWLESGGARVVPIFIGNEANYYRDMMSKVNGILLPGGSVDKHSTGGFSEAARTIVKFALDMNMKKDIFPVFGIGLGMDMLISTISGAKEINSDCSLDSVSASLILSKKCKMKYARLFLPF